MTKYLFAKEYMAPPIFCRDVDEMGHIEISELPVSEKLKQEIQAWDAEYQATFDSTYPPDSSFKNEDAKNAHAAAGVRLAERLQAELGPAYSIEYLE